MVKMRETNVMRVCRFAETMMLDIKIQYAYEAVQGSSKCTAELKNKFCFLHSLLQLGFLTHE